MSAFNFDDKSTLTQSADTTTTAEGAQVNGNSEQYVPAAAEHTSIAGATDSSPTMAPPPVASSLTSPTVSNALPTGATVTAVISADNTLLTPTGKTSLRSPPSADSTSRSTSPAPFPHSPSNSTGIHRSFSRTVSLSPVDLFAHVDSRYPDIIATLSNALHFLNKTGFDHDQVHEHITAKQLAEFEQHNEMDDDISDDIGIKRRDVKVNIDTTGAEDHSLMAEDLLTPDDSGSSCSSDEEDARHHRHASEPLIISPNGSATHSREQSASAARKQRMEEQESFPPSTPDVMSPAHRGAALGPSLPEHSSTVPTKTHGSLDMTNRFDEPAAGSSAGSSHASVNKAAQSSYRSSSPQPPLPPSPPNQRQTSQDDSNLPDENQEKRSSGLFGHRHHSHTHGSRHHHHRRKTMDTRYLSPGGHQATSLQQHYPTIAHSSPRHDQQPDLDADDNKDNNNKKGSGSPNHPQMDVKDDTKTEVTEQVDRQENDDRVITTVTTITTTVHTSIKTTTVLKEKGAVVTAAQSPETAVVWTPTEQSQLLEEILIFYVDLYWENQTNFAPFYKRKLDTWNDKALMIYRHLFQDEKFKSDTKKFLKEPLVEFFEEQLIAKSGQRIGRSGALQPPAAVRYQPSPSSTNSSHEGGVHIGGVHFGQMFMPSASPASTTQQNNDLSVSGATNAPSQSSPSSLAPPATASAAPRRRSSFSLPSLPNPLAAFFSSSSDKTTPPAELDETGVYLQRTNNVCTELHSKYRAVTSTIQQLVSNQILTQGGLPSNITSADELNRAVATILCSRDVLQLLSEYHPAYQTAVVEFPGRVLMSRTLRHRIESLAYMPINFTDLIVGVNEITEILRKCFQKIARLHPDMIQKLVASKRLKTLREIHFNQRKDKAGYPDSFSAWLYESRVYPKLFGSDTFDLLKSVGWCDARTFHLISEHRLQEALWRLKDLGREKESSTLERLIYDKILGDEAANVSGVENLGGGFTTTKLINFPSQDIRGVYKPDHGTLINPKDWKLQTLKDSIVSNYKKEIAAYKIDQLLKINHVPITKQTTFHGEIGSLQYFISDATVARAVNDIDIKNPTKAGKWTTANGRTELPRTIKMYDWFINNRDRNLDNYLLADDGRIILIDHGWTFVAPPTNPSSQFLKSIIPREPVYNNVKAVYMNQPLIDNELNDLLGKNNLSAFKNRLKTFVNFVEKRIAKKGRDETFRVPNVEDWQPVLD